MQAKEATEAFVSEFDSEMARTRKELERVPDGKFAWKPHVKSTAMGNLASHIVNLAGFGGMILQVESLDVTKRAAPFVAKTQKELLEAFDKNVATSRAAVASATAEDLAKTWTLYSGDKVIFALPRTNVLWAMLVNHIIHHRAQLGVYLRLNDIPVPSIYGPSADEPM